MWLWSRFVVSFRGVTKRLFPFPRALERRSSENPLIHLLYFADPRRVTNERSRNDQRLNADYFQQFLSKFKILFNLSHRLDFHRINFERLRRPDVSFFFFFFREYLSFPRSNYRARRKNEIDYPLSAYSLSFELISLFFFFFFSNFSLTFAISNLVQRRVINSRYKKTREEAPWIKIRK